MKLLEKKTINYLRLNRRYLSLGFLLVIIVISYRNWFLKDAVFFGGDGVFRFDEYTRWLYTTFNTWLAEAGIGNANIQIYFLPTRLLWSILVNVGISSMLAVKITHLFPIAILSLVSPYILFKKLAKNELAALAGALFYGTTTYLFASIARGHTPIAMVYVLTPLILYFFICALEKNVTKNWIHFALIYSIGITYELRIMFIVTIILMIYFLFFYFSEIRKSIKNIIFSILLILALNLFWILPTITSKIVDTIKTTSERGLFGDQLFDLLKAFALFHFSWTGGQPSAFDVQPITLYFWLIPLLVFSLLLIKKAKNKKFFLFFCFLALLGIFLTKQSDAFLPDSYSWLYNNFPGFKLFRNASKFYLITAIGYAGTVAYFVAIVKTGKNIIIKRYAPAMLFLCVLFVATINLQPLALDKIGSMFTPKHIPTDYTILKEYISKQPDYFRVIATPQHPRWSFYSIIHPAVNNIGVNNTSWQKFINFTNENSKVDKSIQSQILDIYNKSYSNYLFDISSIKYIFVPIDDFENNADPFSDYGRKDDPAIRNWYISELDKISWLKKIDIGTKELAIFENKQYKSHIYTDTRLDFVAADMTTFDYDNNNSTLYLNSHLDSESKLMDNFNNIIVPVTYDNAQLEILKRQKDDCQIKKCNDKIINQVEEYQRGGFFQNYNLKIPFRANYYIYFKNDVVMDLKTVTLDINGTEVRQNLVTTNIKNKDGYKYFSKIQLNNDQYNLKLFSNNQQIKFLFPDSLVFVAENDLPDIAVPILEYKQISATKYIVNVLNAKESFPLIFSESYHQNWGIFAKAELASKDENKFQSDNNQGTIQNENLVPNSFYDIFLGEPILKNNHFQVNNFQNGWWIDLPEIKRQGLATINENGTYNFQLTIEFTPQKYFYIGLFISVFSFLGCFYYLISKFIRKRKERLTLANEKQNTYNKST